MVWNELATEVDLEVQTGGIKYHSLEHKQMNRTHASLIYLRID